MKKKAKNNNVWIAALAGASAGVIAGLLMAPETGKNTRGTLKKGAARLGDGIDDSVRAAKSKISDIRSSQVLNVKDNWDTVRGKIKERFDNLTDQDLTYLQGKEEEFLDNLQSKVGKSKRELVNWINKLA